MPNSIVFSNPGASIIRWGDGVAAPYLTLSVNGSTTLVGAAVTGTVTNTGSASGQWSTASAPADVLISPSSGTVAVNSFATVTYTPLAAGVKVITLSSSTPGATIVGSPASLTVTSPAPPPPPPPPPPSAAPTGNITQFLTSDGGSASYSGNFSGPTRDYWHRRLGFAWKRTNTLGNWLDASQVEEGGSAFGTSAAITAVDQVLVITANALVSRWMSTGQNRGAYLKVNSGSAFPVAFYGRTDATDANRPKLTVITSTGTFVLTAAANAYWYNSSFTGIGSAAEWRLSSGAAVAVLRFDLSTVTGVVSGATLTIKVKSFPSGGSTGQVVGLYECDPPTIIVPENVVSPALGIADTYADFNTYKASGDAALIAADDFELGGPFDGGFTPDATRILNTATGTTYARGEITTGSNGSANSRLEVSSGTGTQGIPNIVRPEVYGQYWLYLESDFGTTQDDAIKIPAMGVQFGYWVSTGGSTGYWQQTTGNGGYAGTGLKVDRGGGLNFEYQGHSVRFLTGTRKTALDDDPYDGWFGMGIYDYNLDQAGPFPAGASFEMVAIRPLQQYCIDIRVLQNTMTGAQDALGNYATANADGAYQVWINGYQVYSRTNYRWRKHEEFGVQGMWIDVYHGGTSTQSAPGSHYQLDRVSLATSYIGPKAATLPSYVPAAGELATLTVANGKLTNQWRDVIDAYYEPFYSVKSVNDYSGAFKNPYWGTYGCTVFFGGGHAGGNYNGVIVAEYGATAITYKRACNATPWYGTGTDNDTRTNNGGGLATNSVTNLNYMESTIDGKPGAPHSYGCGDIVGPEYGGANNGTFLRVLTAAVNRVNDNGTVAAHQLPFTSTSGSGGAGNWGRVTNEYRTDLTNWFAPQLTAFVGPQQRVYIQTNNSTANVRWFDRNLNTWVNGSGTTFGFDGADGFDSGSMFYVPSRGLLLCLYPVAGNLTIQWMDVTVTQPTLGGTATLSTPVAVGSPWSAGTWCPDNDRIIVGKAAQTGVYEITIPSTLSSTWTVDYAAFTTGGTFPLETTGQGGNTYKKFAYDERIKSIVYQRSASDSGTDTVYIYRPRNT